LYLSLSKAQSQAAGYYYLTSAPGLQDARPYNGLVHVYCWIIKELLSSTTEAELGALFHNSDEAYPLCTVLTKMGHPQMLSPSPPTITLPLESLTTL
jgi:hypothetical protein